MGGISRTFRIQATSSEEAYNKIIESELKRYGDAPYTGSAASCSLGRQKGPTFSKYSDENINVAEKYVNDVEQGGTKYVLNYVNLGQAGYRVVTVEKEVVKHGTPRSVYNVYLSNRDELTFIKKFYDKRLNEGYTPEQMAEMGKDYFIKDLIWLAKVDIRIFNKWFIQEQIRQIMDTYRKIQ